MRGGIFMLRVKNPNYQKKQKLMSKVRSLSLTIFFLMVGLAVACGGYHPATPAEPLSLTQDAHLEKTAQPTSVDDREMSSQDKLKTGKELFAQWCSSCHNSGSTTTKVGPGLKGILKMEKLPASGLSVSLDNIRQAIVNPQSFMPVQSYLTDVEVDCLIEFLKTI
jgi:mono/diheme cytochrome c family protein